MKIGSLSSVSGPRTLFGAYAKEADQSKKLIQQNFNSGVDAAAVSINDLRSHLLHLADKVNKFSDLNGFFGGLQRSPNQTTQSSNGSGETQPTEPGGSTPPPAPQTPITFSLSIENANKPRKFERQIEKALRKGFENGDDKILKNPNLRGDVKIEVRDGENVSSFSVNVDGDTTAQDFVNQINAKSGGKVDAQLKARDVSGDTRFKIALKGVRPEGPPPPVEAEDTDLALPTPTQGADEDGEFVLGEDLNVGRLSQEAAALERELKGFVTAFNSLVDYAKRNSKNKDGLEQTAIDDSLISQLQNSFETAKSEDGRLSFESFVTARQDGKLQVDAKSFQGAFFEDPDAVVDVLKNLALDISGSGGIAREYSAADGKFEQALGSVQFRLARQAATDLDRLERGEEVKSNPTISEVKLTQSDLARRTTNTISKIA